MTAWDTAWVVRGPGLVDEIAAAMREDPSDDLALPRGLILMAHEEGAVLGCAGLRLDTRGDLTEARRLYARHGYREVPAFSQGLYTDHWFEKILS
jgi:hypothetical protein